MFRMEFIRAFRSYNFLFALSIALIAFVFGLYGYSEYMIFIPKYVHIVPKFFYNAYDAAFWAAQDSIAPLIVPFVAALPFADSLAIDRVNGYQRFVLIRTSYKQYLSAKITACTLSGGLALALPLLILFSCTNLLFPRGLNLVSTSQKLISESFMLGPFAWLYTINPDLYVLTTIGCWFIGGAAYALLGLATATFTNHRYVILAAPLLIYFLANVILALLDIAIWSPFILFNPRAIANVTWINMMATLICSVVASLSLIVATALRTRERA